ncbi:helix-turn-helix domain-containing protein [Halovivax cerinus]|uniref:Helix-turn-helix domain-containing protein n=1 Tax=Halovivax cerinus TaxID=1487865 RepID=A0ABD5NMY5_9EURY|nr:helix-turn-helix domain-containing protein [Halovivax cerinus]
MSIDAGGAASRDPADAGIGEELVSTPPTDGPGVVAEVHLDHDRLLLRPTLRRLDDATAVPEYHAGGPDRRYQFVSFSVADETALEAALERDRTVTNPVLVDRNGGRLVYRLDVTERALTVHGAIAEQGGRIVDARCTQTAWVVQLRFPAREALVSFNEACKDIDISLQVTHLRSADDSSDPVVGLTAKQEELLAVAFDEGYFEVPRGISQDQLAERLGVSKSAISQRLRRALTELCSTTLSTASSACSDDNS